MMAAKTALTQRSFALEKPGCTDEVEEGCISSKSEKESISSVSDAVSEFNVDGAVPVVRVSAGCLSLRLRRLQQETLI